MGGFIPYDGQDIYRTQSWELITAGENKGKLHQHHYLVTAGAMKICCLILGLLMLLTVCDAMCECSQFIIITSTVCSEVLCVAYWLLLFIFHSQSTEIRDTTWKLLLQLFWQTIAVKICIQYNQDPQTLPKAGIHVSLLLNLSECLRRSIQTYTAFDLQVSF